MGLFPATDIKVKVSLGPVNCFHSELFLVQNDNDDDDDDDDEDDVDDDEDAAAAKLKQTFQRKSPFIVGR